MLKILAPIDGSHNAERVIDYLIQLASRAKGTEITLINVREPVDAPQVHRFWNDQQIREFQQQEGDLLLDAARKRLDSAGVRYSAEVIIGEIAPAIATQASAKGCDMIVMGTRGMGTIANLLMGSVATKVVHLATVPVTLVK